jgi:hypothetical protein
MPFKDSPLFITAWVHRMSKTGAYRCHYGIPSQTLRQRCTLVVLFSAQYSQKTGYHIQDKSRFSAKITCWLKFNISTCSLQCSPKHHATKSSVINFWPFCVLELHGFCLCTVSGDVGWSTLWQIQHREVAVLVEVVLVLCQQGISS